MSVVSDAIVANVRKGGGKVTWEKALAGLSDNDKRRAMQEIRSLEAQKILRRVIARQADDKPSFTVQLSNYVEPATQP